jgi:hypothetical protein
MSPSPKSVKAATVALGAALIGSIIRQKYPNSARQDVLKEG